MHIDLMDTHLMHRYQEVWWDNHHVLETWSIVHVLVTISKTPSLFTCFHLMIFSMFVFMIVLHVVNTCLDVVFVKTCVYTCISSERHLIHIRLHFIVHLYSLYAHV